MISPYWAKDIDPDQLAAQTSKFMQCTGIDILAPQVRALLFFFSSFRIDMKSGRSWKL